MVFTSVVPITQKTVTEASLVLPTEIKASLGNLEKFHLRIKVNKKVHLSPR